MSRADNSTSTITEARWLQTYRRHLDRCVECAHERGRHAETYGCEECPCTAFRP